MPVKVIIIISIFQLNICHYVSPKYVTLLISENQAAVSNTSRCGDTKEHKTTLYLLFLVVQVVPEVLWVPAELVLVSQEDQRCQESQGHRGNQLLLSYLGIQGHQGAREDLGLPLNLNSATGKAEVEKCGINMKK